MCLSQPGSVVSGHAKPTIALPQRLGPKPASTTGPHDDFVQKSLLGGIPQPCPAHYPGPQIGSNVKAAGMTPDEQPWALAIWMAIARAIILSS